MSLDVQEIFTPQQSGVTTNPNVPPANGTWLSFLINAASIVGLPTTAWQTGGVERTQMAMLAVGLSIEDGLISGQNQGGFLDPAASGSVTVIDTNGNAITSPVTPDPSIPSQNPTGAPGWLDAIGQYQFETERVQASYAAGQLAIANTTGTTLAYISGNYHVANKNTNATYANTENISIPTSIIAGTGGIVANVLAGVTTTTIVTQSAHGLGPGDVVYIAGVGGVVGLTAAFAFVSTVPSATSFTIGVATQGTFTSGGNVYKCTIVNCQADVVGPSSSAGPGEVTTTVTQNSGVFVSNPTAWGAANYESNQAYAARCRAKLAAISPNGAADAYNYTAKSSSQILAAQTPPVTLTNGPIVQADTFANPQTSEVTVLVASSSPASGVLGEPVTPGCAQLGVSGATNASPIVVTTASPHNLSTGDQVLISGVVGNEAANGGFTITKITNTAFSLNGSTGSGAYTQGGIVEGGDLGQIDNLIQKTCVPDGQQALTRSSLAFPILVVATVVVPQAYVSSYLAAATISLQNLFATFPIGGIIEPGDSFGTIAISAIIGALTDAGQPAVGVPSFVRRVAPVSLNGVEADLPYPSPEHYAILLAPAINVVGV